MVELARGMPGSFSTSKSVRGADGFGITVVSYWHDETSIVAWRQHSEHLIAQERGRRAWYVHYDIRIAKVERAYAGPAMRRKAETLILRAKLAAGIGDN